ncbi:hypothetical protein V6N11_058570 [Hibiscus sabdariffa]|uniref:Uncharacterized protein n=1 Tax=Hibiscus sabdariffa TaxID=183260 RepID=A0ABR2U577_9ROSI
MNAVHVRDQKHELTPPKDSTTLCRILKFPPRYSPGQDPLPPCRGIPFVILSRQIVEAVHHKTDAIAIDFHTMTQPNPTFHLNSLSLSFTSIFHFHAWEDSTTSSARAGGVMVACQSKMSSPDRLMGSVWPFSADGLIADAAAGGGAVVGCVGKKLAACGNWKQRKLMREFWNTFVSSINEAVKLQSSGSGCTAAECLAEECLGFCWALMAGKWCGHSCPEWNDISEASDSSRAITSPTLNLKHVMMALISTSRV